MSPLLPPVFGLLRILPNSLPQAATTTPNVQPVAADAASNASHSRQGGAEFSPGAQLNGKVVGQNAQSGTQTLQLPDGRQLQFQSARPLPVGTQVTIQIGQNLSALVISLNIPAGTQIQQLLTKYADKWEGLNKAIQSAQAGNSPVASNAMREVLPQANNLLAGMLGVAIATKQNSLKALVSGDLAALLHLDADLAEMHQLHQREFKTGEWRAFFFPYFENKQDENTRQGQFFWRTKDDGESKSTRFVVNLNLSSYGDIQLDGLVRTGQFNTKLRLLKSVDEDFVSGLQALYQETLQNLDLAGDIKVELVEDFEIDPLHELLTTDHLRNVEV